MKFNSEWKSNVMLPLLEVICFVLFSKLINEKWNKNVFPRAMMWVLGDFWCHSNANAVYHSYAFTLLQVLRIFSSPNFRLGGTISAYKIVPDEIEEIKV